MVEKWRNDMFFSHLSSIVRFSWPKTGSNVMLMLDVRTLIIFKSFKKEKQVSVQSGSPIRQSDLLRNPPVE